MSNCNWYCYLPQTKENPNKTQINLKNSHISFYPWPVLKYSMDQDKLQAFIKSVSIVKEYAPKYGVEAEPNPSLPGLKWMGLKPVERPCELGCGDIVADQRIERRLAFTPTRHWKTRCANCQRYVHPDGVTLVDTSQAAQKIYQAWLAGEKPDQPKQVIEHEKYTEIITNTSIIKQFR